MGVGIHTLTHEERVTRGHQLTAEDKGFASISPEARIATGKRTHERGKGVHGLTSADHSAHGKKSKEMGVGVHALTIGERREASRQALEARGETPWTEEEDLFCISLIENQDYRFMHGARKCLDTERIAKELNAKFHEGKNVRTKRSIDSFRYQRLKKYRPEGWKST